MLIKHHGVRNNLFRLLQLFLLVSLGIVLEFVQARSVFSAEKIVLEAGIVEDSISIDSLKTFAQTGKINNDLEFYARYVDKDTLNQLRMALQRRFRTNMVVVSRLLYSPLGADALKQLGTLIRTDARLNGFHALRAAWLQAASNQDGFTLIDLLQDFPSQNIHINIEQFLALQRLFTALTDYTDTSLNAIADQVQQEIVETFPDPSHGPDPLKPGPFPFQQSTFTLQRLTQPLIQQATKRQFIVDLYVPEGVSRRSPIVIVSHGLGSTPAAFAYLGTHLASHGFVVAIPQHIGSGARQFQDLFDGLSNTNVQLNSFVERPLDVKQVIDALEKRAQTDLAGKLDLSNIGIIGHSLGGYTALASAGATLNLERIWSTCKTEGRLRINLSFGFQCLNEALPFFDTRILKDSRIKAAIAINPVTSIVFGPQGMGTLQVPTMLIGSSRDILAPLIPEQVNPFFWLKTPDKYLSVIVPAGHTAADATDSGQNPLPNSFSEFLSGPDPALARQYIRALAVVFMQSYIGNQPAYRPYLRAGFARSIQQKPLQLDLVQALTPQMLEQAYGGRPPIPFFPPSLAPSAAGHEPSAPIKN